MYTVFQLFSFNPTVINLRYFMTIYNFLLKPQKFNTKSWKMFQILKFIPQITEYPIYQWYQLEENSKTSPKLSEKRHLKSPETQFPFIYEKNYHLPVKQIFTMINCRQNIFPQLPTVGKTDPHNYRLSVKQTATITDYR